jgi:hypothetical protein
VHFDRRHLVEAKHLVTVEIALDEAAVSAAIRIRSSRSGFGTRSRQKFCNTAIHGIGNTGRYTCQAKVFLSYSWLALLSYGC